MAGDWRFIGIDVHDAYMNMAVDEAILTMRGRGESPNTVRLYRWRPSAVSIGYSQAVDEVVNLPACRSLGVDVVRRISGGGAILHDFCGELTYSVVVALDSAMMPDDVARSYEVICGGLLGGLRRLGVAAEYRLPRDPRYCPSIYASRKKISGNAQTRRRGVVLQHGTIMIGTDLGVMEKVLKLPRPAGAARPLEESVTTIERELGKALEFEEVAEALKLGFSEAFGCELSDGRLSREELQLALNLRDSKYSTAEWNFGRLTSNRRGEDSSPVTCANV